jgi:uncharacterized membrane protein YgdD (TMEM256/DUF423 family)
MEGPTKMVRGFLIAGSLVALLAVALGAFGAHALRAHFEARPELQPNYQTAVQYHFFHAFALIAVAWAANEWAHPMIPVAGYLFGAGVLLFSGSLYLLSLTGVRAWGAVTPFGGVAFLLGWALLAWGVFRS